MKKPGIALILGSKHSEPDGDEGEDDIDVSEDELEAVKTLRSAKDDEEYAKALKAFIKLCEDY